MSTGLTVFHENGLSPMSLSQNPGVPAFFPSVGGPFCVRPRRGFPSAGFPGEAVPGPSLISGSPDVTRAWHWRSSFRHSMRWPNADNDVFGESYTCAANKADRDNESKPFSRMHTFLLPK